MRNATRAGMLVVLWLLAWGEVSVANLLSGVAVAVALLVAFPLGRVDARRFRSSPIGVARLLAYVASQLVTSNAVVARQIVSRRPTVEPGVIAHQLDDAGDDVVITLMTSIIALSPGTMTVDVDRAGRTLYVHFLLLHDVAAARAYLVRLERLVRNALGLGPPVVHA